MSDINKLHPNIGSRVYIVVPAKFVVAPARVVERITRETPEGMHTTYMLDFGQSGKNRVPSSNIPDGIVVGSCDDAYKVMLEEATKLAQGAVTRARENGDKRFGRPPEETLGASSPTDDIDVTNLEDIAAQMNQEFLEMSQHEDGACKTGDTSDKMYTDEEAQEEA